MSLLLKTAPSPSLRFEALDSFLLFFPRFIYILFFLLAFFSVSLLLLPHLSPLLNMAEEEQNLLFMPTWTIASVCTVFVVTCLVIERLVYFVGHLFRSRKQNALLEALEKIKEELMLVGLISIALSVGQNSILDICVPRKWMNVMLQCARPGEQEEEGGETTGKQSSCEGDTVPFMQVEGVHQLHILLFVLVIVHVFYSIMIMALGIWKVSQWKAWEERSNTAEGQFVQGQYRLTKEVTFIKRHAGLWSKNVFLGYLAAFFQQFFKSVSETDYHTLRHGFIVNHKLRRDIDFHMYIVKSLEEDFKHVVGVSPYLWGITILLILLNVDGWKINFFAPLLPLIMVLIVGMKLRYIITAMAVQFYEKHSVVEGIASVTPTDELFWFGKPRLILHFMHFILFQDAFQVTIHLWSAFTFRENNCLSKHPYVVLMRLMFGIMAQVICGYVMLPIYAIVSQMGSRIKHKTVISDIEMKNENRDLTEERSVTVTIPPSEAKAQTQQVFSVSSEKILNGSGEPELDPPASSTEEITEGRGDAGIVERKTPKTGRSFNGRSYRSL